MLAGNKKAAQKSMLQRRQFSCDRVREMRTSFFADQEDAIMDLRHNGSERAANRSGTALPINQ